MKKLTSTITVLALIMGMSLNAVASQSNIKVFIDGQEKTFQQPPVMLNNHTLVPLRGIFEEMGATVVWDNATQTIKATKEDAEVTLQIGSKLGVKNGQPVQLEQAAELVNGSTMVPLRFVSESFGADVKWDGNANSITINKPVIATKQATPQVETPQEDVQQEEMTAEEQQPEKTYTLDEVKGIALQYGGIVETNGYAPDGTFLLVRYDGQYVNPATAVNDLYPLSGLGMLLGYVNTKIDVYLTDDSWFTYTINAYETKQWLDKKLTDNEYYNKWKKTDIQKKAPEIPKAQTPPIQVSPIQNTPVQVDSTVLCNQIQDKYFQMWLAKRAEFSSRGLTDSGMVASEKGKIDRLMYQELQQCGCK